jgi:lipase chaperone LimK
MVMVCTLYFFPQVIYLNAERFKRILNPQEAYWWKMDQALNATYIFDKPFLDPFLSLDQFGELVQKDTREIRDFFELYLFTSFTDEMNRLRVQFAKNLIKQGCQQKACLNNLYKDSGFARAEDLEHYFSEFEGLTVKEFILTLK